MSQYRRSTTKGGTYFFTLVSYNRRKIFCNDDFLHAFKQSIKNIQHQYPFEILAWVQMPDHLHCIWKMPMNDANYGMRWSQIKRLTTHSCPRYHLSQNELSLSQIKRNEKGIWQRRFYEHEIRDDLDFQRHVDYIHFNPVKHGYVLNPTDWAYSTIHKFIKNGDYRADWGCDGMMDTVDIDYD